MIDLPQGNYTGHTSVQIPTAKERQEYKDDIKAQEKGYIAPETEHRIKRYELLYTTKRDNNKTPKIIETPSATRNKVFRGLT